MMVRNCAAVILAGAIFAVQPLAAQGKPQSDIDRAADVVASPVRAVGVDTPKVPPLLETALKAPYSSAGTKTCAAIATSVRDLDGVLGRDADQPVPPGKSDTATELAFAAAQSAIGSLIPGLGIIKEISGAAKAERHARTAVFAGALRRGYLKGLGQGRGCKPPAAPLAAAMKPPLATPEPAKK